MNPLLDRLRSRTAAFSLRDSRRAYFPAGFVDDKPRRQGGEVHGVPVLGPTEAIPEIVAREEIDLLLLAAPSETAKEMRRLVELCEGTGRPFRTVPELRNLMSAQVSISQLRPVSIEDLLGRDPVSLDWEGIRCGLFGRVVLVTGAGGSIGSELVRQLAAAGPSRLILVDNGEDNLYRIEMELLERFPQLRFTRHLVDVADAGGWMRSSRPSARRSSSMPPPTNRFPCSRIKSGPRCPTTSPGHGSSPRLPHVGAASVSS